MRYQIWTGGLRPPLSIAFTINFVDRYGMYIYVYVHVYVHHSQIARARSNIIPPPTWAATPPPVNNTNIMPMPPPSTCHLHGTPCHLHGNHVQSIQYNNDVRPPTSGCHSSTMSKKLKYSTDQPVGGEHGRPSSIHFFFFIYYYTSAQV